MPRGLSNTRKLAVWAACKAAREHVDGGAGGEPKARWVNKAIRAAGIENGSDQRTFKATLRTEIARLEILKEVSGELDEAPPTKGKFWENVGLVVGECACGAHHVATCLSCGRAMAPKDINLCFEANAETGAILSCWFDCLHCGSHTHPETYATDGRHAIAVVEKEPEDESA